MFSYQSGSRKSQESNTIIFQSVEKPMQRLQWRILNSNSTKAKILPHKWLWDPFPPLVTCSISSPSGIHLTCSLKTLFKNSTADPTWCEQQILTSQSQPHEPCFITFNKLQLFVLHINFRWKNLWSRHSCNGENIKHFPRYFLLAEEFGQPLIKITPCWTRQTWLWAFQSCSCGSSLVINNFKTQAEEAEEQVTNQIWALLIFWLSVSALITAVLKSPKTEKKKIS